jgi:hypothetical protein
MYGAAAKNRTASILLEETPPGAGRAILGMVGPTCMGPTPVAVPEMNWKEGRVRNNKYRQGKNQGVGKSQGVIQE